MRRRNKRAEFQKFRKRAWRYAIRRSKAFEEGVGGDQMNNETGTRKPAAGPGILNIPVD